MIDKRFVHLVTKLHENTLRKRISWRPTPDNEVFEAVFPQYSLRIGLKQRRETLDYVINILNDEGIAVEDFSDEDLSRDFSLDAPQQGWFRFMGEIHEMARRQALGADQAIDAILGELE